MVAVVYELISLVSSSDVQQIVFLAQFYSSKLFVVQVHTVNLR